MLLQRPKLSLYPRIFQPKLNSIVFDRNIHSKSVGSDRRSNHILYYIWPTIKRDEKLLDLSIQVIVRDKKIQMEYSKRK